MTDGQLYKNALSRLEDAKLLLGQPEIKPLVVAKEEVLLQFQPIFSADHLPDLSEAEFRSFLQFKNNKHWSSIHRQGPRMCRDMNQLRSALDLLTDVKRPLAERYDQAVQSVPGMGKAVATAILHVVYPEQFGVWNRVAEDSLKTLKLWPNFAAGTSDGKRYAKLNGHLVDLARRLHIDLWTLDAIWWAIQYNEGKK
jgi:hypothetical protein